MSQTRTIIYKVSLFFLFVFLPLILFAQESAPGKLIVCYGLNADNVNNTTARNRAADSRSSTVNLKTSTFEVTYKDFPIAAQNAFQFAADIWQNQLHSDIPIRVTATWTALTGNTLANTRSSKIYRGFEGAINSQIWYPVALAEKITRTELNPINEADIEISVNNNKTWYFGTDGNPPKGTVDFISVILHEIAHGLGFSSSASVTADRGLLRESKYFGIYDVLLENDVRTRLSSYADSSAQLKNQFTSGKIYLYSPSAVTADGSYPKIFAPATFISGSSISHLDETKYPVGNADALMSPYLVSNEANHSLGTILPQVLNDIGWGDNTVVQSSVKIFPNPGNGIFNVKIEMPVTIDKVGLYVTDLAGREILHINDFVQSSVNLIDLSGVADGIYLLKVSSDLKPIVKKIVVVK